MASGSLPDRWFPRRPQSVLNRVMDPGMPFGWSVNPYRGCGHGCHFCYARGTHTWLGYHADDSFRNNILVKRDADRVLRSELKKGRWKGGGIAIGTATDPYQQLEGKLGVTRSILEVLREYGIPCSITTRSPLILRDLDLLKEMKVTSVQISVSTLDETVWERTEPASPHPRQRFRTVSELVKAGVPAGFFLAPVIPYLTDSEETVEEVARKAAAVGAHFLSPSLLRLKPEVKSWFFRRIQPYYPLEAARLARLYEGARAPASFHDSLMARIRSQIESAGLSLSVSDPDGGEAFRFPKSSEREGEPPVQLCLF
ncbi:SPL family radical SAM protein [Desmospora profundinema]|uniref:DNA repair photolyase n=1 Tax=Desmospora profundinema TaxID=1571184 RepID=A0ABU1IRU2_9BACL|nr:radical SAM protein [Desmospora profundinema]MDR6227406.1 DNA repair photolyase [Desmospora profundinema]